MIEVMILSALVAVALSTLFLIGDFLATQDGKRGQERAEDDPIRQAEAESERIRQHIEERQREIRKIVQRMQEDAMREHLHNIARQHYEQGEVIDTDGSVVHRRALPARTRYDA